MLTNHELLANEIRILLANPTFTPNDGYLAIIEVLAEMMVHDSRELAVEMAADGDLSDGETPDQVGVNMALESLRVGESTITDDIDNAINRMYCAEDPAPTPVYRYEMPAGGGLVNTVDGWQWQNADDDLAAGKYNL